ncbi:MAG: PilN domain-containing protein [Bdellovibrionota bacterium]|nr:PilN domain-containing protein [Bdellovibrionota bacterium]
MIEINLLKGFSAEGLGGGESTLSATFATSQKVVYDEKDLLLKLVILIIPSLMLYGYEFYDEGVGAEALKLKQRQVEKLTQELAGFGKQVAEVRKIKEEKNRLTSRIDTIKEISKERLSNAKALDALHDIVPSQAWLKSLTIESGKVSIIGEATEDLVVSQLLRNLDESIYFNDVKLLSSTEVRKSGGSYKAFKIDCVLGQ